MFFLFGCGFGDDWNHVGKLCEFEVASVAAEALVGKFHDTRRSGKQSVVLTHENIVSGTDYAPTLANDNITGFDVFTGVFLYTQALTLGIAAVTSRTASLFMCHKGKWEMGARLRDSL